MDIISPTTTATATVKTPEAESRIQPIKPLIFTNGVLKRLNNHHHHHLNPPPTAVVVTYKECLKNHAATMGGHAVDGCGEFMSSPTATSTDPTSLKCAACGCHRNFHRREPEDPIVQPTTTSAAQHVIEYQPHHRHHPPPPPPPPLPQPLRCGDVSPNSPSPPPISSSYYPSAPHMLLALSSGHLPENNHPAGAAAIQSPNSNGRKRFRTKFTQDQKTRMYEFAEKIGWKIQKRDEERISDFCSEVGVERTVLKVWMHNNKNTLGKKVDQNHTTIIINDNNNNGTINNGGDHHHHHHHHHQNSDSVSPRVVATNGSSSSS